MAEGMNMVQGKLQVGWSRGDITPLRKTFVQGQFHTRISDEVLSPLTATALALEVKAEDGAVEQAVLLSCDLCNDGFKPDLLRALDGRCPDLDLYKLTVNCTHTHTAPCMKRGVYDEPEDDPDFMDPDEYREWLAVQLADGSGLGSYLPTQRGLDGGHYSAMIKSNWVGPEGGQMLVDETVATIDALFEDVEYARTR